MRAIITICLLMLCCGMASAQVNWANEPIIVKEIKGQTIRSVTVKTLSGNISVIGTSNKPSIEVYVDAINEATMPIEQVRQMVKQDYAIDMMVKDHQLMVSASCKYGDSNWKKALSISFKIFVPRSVMCNLNSKVGSINLVNLTGDQNFTTNGAVNLETINGNVKGRTDGGLVNISNSGPDIDITTIGGDVVAEGCYGNTRLNTGKGDINLSRLKGIIDATTTAGNIQGDQINGKFTITTNRGDIILKRMSCDLIATSTKGNVNAELTIPCKAIKINVAHGDANIQLAAKKGFDMNMNAKKITATDLPRTFKGNNDGLKLIGAVYGGGIPIEVQVNEGELKLKFI
ncbi:DUF4097 family beta strand repeat-containing protein [Mucilaginibacter sp. KACC 22063]|uniref:DUF4097 family beta strand repeat-containing protein n=1 Tax=Mucilaginibacter sp. KACC 22063 TaxID=3025666 RepID=UPI00236733C8|nr:DUF4097 family beta strand repeat-containing protein [Mucilaginibacter sp. KACC 22063]WDF53439.1 DUF4097 family beta strand repeat-containing protein [Mucilaginibacter sp. KACC 22063]